MMTKHNTFWTEEMTPSSSWWDRILKHSRNLYIITASHHEETNPSQPGTDKRIMNSDTISQVSVMLLSPISESAEKTPSFWYFLNLRWSSGRLIFYIYNRDHYTHNTASFQWKGAPSKCTFEMTSVAEWDKEVHTVFKETKTVHTFRNSATDRLAFLNIKDRCTTEKAALCS